MKPLTIPVAEKTLIRPGLEMREYRERRARLLESLSGEKNPAVGLVFAGEQTSGGVYKANSDFVYLTGVTTEPGAAVLFNPSAEDPARKIVLFLRPMNPEADRWERYRDPLSERLKVETGFETVLRTTQLPAALTTAARRTRRLATLHTLAAYTGDVSPDLAVFRKVAERVPGAAIEDRSTLLAQMRAVKSKGEMELMRRAAEATARGYENAIGIIRPGVGEREIQRALEGGYLDSGAEGSAYGAIVGSGLNATLLHYGDNAGACGESELVLIDSGASFAGYACDVTRTFPVGGTFTPEHRAVYDVVLRAQLAAIRAAKPGVFMWEVDRAAREVLKKAEMLDAYIHGIGHQLGLEVHDATPDGPLKPGMVITVEPGVYLPDQRLGVRIEDSVVITARGNSVLTDDIPKTVSEIETAMASRKAPPRR